jgi:hypothetical protein
MVWELLLGSVVLVVVHLVEEVFIQWARRTSICEVARAIQAGGLVVDNRGSRGVMVIQIPGPGLSLPGSADDQIVP